MKKELKLSDEILAEEIFKEDIEILDLELTNKYEREMIIDRNLTRQLVSFQANKQVPFYRWYKYKEGFSNELVNYYIDYNGVETTKDIFDPFAGSGSTLFTSSERGINSCGIELLPIGIEIIEARNILMNNFTESDFARLRYYQEETPWVSFTQSKPINELNITKDAYPKETKELIEKFLAIIEKESEIQRRVLSFALLCILENISYTRKDGQYLRWDYRSGRKGGKNPFNKGEVMNFNDSITKKIDQIISDVIGPRQHKLFDSSDSINRGKIDLIHGSCLTEILKIRNDSFNLIITSPPYANRYDYTRTYALELAMLNVSSEELSKLRQTMLSCTVENKEKDLLSINPKWKKVIKILEKQELLQKILEYLFYMKSTKSLNNNGIPRMVKGYFYELACVIFELHRILRKNGAIVMVNDNVRYAGVGISVDLILSDIAHSIGFNIEKISVLPNGKGNSSQQMGSHGRKPLRKCVYIWRKA